MARIYTNAFIDDKPETRYLLLPALGGEKALVVHINDTLSLFFNNPKEETVQAVIDVLTNALEELKERSGHGI
jgi:hypothetical protein